MGNWLKLERASAPLIPADLVVEQSGVRFIDGQDEMDYLWYQLRETEAGQETAGYRVVRLVQLLGLVNSTPDFTAQPAVSNGASDLFAEVFGPAAGVGRCAGRGAVDTCR